MQGEIIVTVDCSVVGRQVELSLCYDAVNGFGCAVECNCLNGNCSCEEGCRAQGGKDCKLQKWLEDDPL